VADVNEVLREYARAFDARAYWDAHEVLEQWWRQDRRDLWQALIQLAAAFVHVDAGRLPGAARVLARAMARLDAEPDDTPEIDIAAVRAHGHALLDHVRGATRFDERHRFRIAPLLRAAAPGRGARI
jgi:predicted metal-dependent hydrolase